MENKDFIAGIYAALEMYDFEKTSFIKMPSAGDLKNMLIGDPTGAIRQFRAGQIFKPGGMWSAGKLLNPPGMVNKLFNVGLPAYSIYKSIQGYGDPAKTTAQNVLGTAGAAVGSLMGAPALGIVGSNIGGRLGQAAGNAIGRFIPNRMTPRSHDPMVDDSQFGQRMGMASLPPIAAPTPITNNVNKLTPTINSGVAGMSTSPTAPLLTTPGVKAATLEKIANPWAGKLVRALSTPIPGTPKLLMNMRTPLQLDALEQSVTNAGNKYFHGGIAKGLQKLKVDRVFQKLEPFIGNATDAPDLRATFGARQVHNWAHQPVRQVAGMVPIPSFGSIYQGARDGVGKLLGVKPPMAFGQGAERGVQLELPGVKKFLNKPKPGLEFHNADPTSGLIF